MVNCDEFLDVGVETTPTPRLLLLMWRRDCPQSRQLQRAKMLRFLNNPYKIVIPVHRLMESASVTTSVQAGMTFFRRTEQST